MSDLIRFADGEFVLGVEPHDTDGFRVLAPGLARALGFREAYDLLRSMPHEEKGSEPVRTPGGDQQVGYVTEAGFYRALGQRQAARIPDALMRDQVERFQSWVYREVLPSIRKGTAVPSPYAVPQTFAEALELAAKVVRELEESEQARRELEPAAHSWTTLADAGGDYSLRQAAQILDRDPVISTGQNRLSAYLRGIGWLDSGGEPYQRHVDAGRLVRRATNGYDHPDRGHVATWQVRITTKGLHELHRLMDGSGPLLLATQRERSAS